MLAAVAADASVATVAHRSTCGFFWVAVGQLACAR